MEEFKMKRVSLQVEVKNAVQFNSAKEVELVRAGLEARIRAIKIELEKPLAAGVAKVLRDEMYQSQQLHDIFVDVKRGFQK
jgi:hypothetical protein